jgi:hypothetical protein
VRWGRRGALEPWPSTADPTSRCSPASDGDASNKKPLPGTVPGVQMVRLAATRHCVFNHGLHVHNEEGGEW